MPKTWQNRVHQLLLRRRLRRQGVVVHNGAVLSSVEFLGTAKIEPYCRLTGDPKIVCGDDFYLNTFCTLLGEITFGEHVQIGPHTVMWGRDHGMAEGAPMRAQPHAKAPIRVGDDVWIGASCVILKGVTVGSGAVVGAGSVVTRDVPERAVVAGNPAQVIKQR